jgi:hypothetical protein
VERVKLYTTLTSCLQSHLQAEPNHTTKTKTKHLFCFCFHPFLVTSGDKNKNINIFSFVMTKLVPQFCHTTKMKQTIQLAHVPHNITLTSCSDNTNDWLRPTDCCNQSITVASHHQLLPAANDRLLPPAIIVLYVVNDWLEWLEYCPPPHLLFTWPWCPHFGSRVGQLSPRKASVVGIDDKAMALFIDFKLLGLTNFEQCKMPLLPMRAASGGQIFFPVWLTVLCTQVPVSFCVSTSSTDATASTSFVL